MTKYSPTERIILIEGFTESYIVRAMVKQDVVVELQQLEIEVGSEEVWQMVEKFAENCRR
jgi:hypothetical protein